MSEYKHGKYKDYSRSPKIFVDNYLLKIDNKYKGYFEKRSKEFKRFCIKLVNSMSLSQNKDKINLEGYSEAIKETNLKNPSLHSMQYLKLYLLAHKRGKDFFVNESKASIYKWVSNKALVQEALRLEEEPNDKKIADLRNVVKNMADLASTDRNYYTSPNKNANPGSGFLDQIYSDMVLKLHNEYMSKYKSYDNNRNRLKTEVLSKMKDDNKISDEEYEQLKKDFGVENEVEWKELKANIEKIYNEEKIKKIQNSEKEDIQKLGGNKGDKATPEEFKKAIEAGDYEDGEETKEDGKETEDKESTSKTTTRTSGFISKPESKGGLARLIGTELPTNSEPSVFLNKAKAIQQEVEEYLETKHNERTNKKNNTAATKKEEEQNESITFNSLLLNEFQIVANDLEKYINKLITLEASYKKNKSVTEYKYKIIKDSAITYNNFTLACKKMLQKDAKKDRGSFIERTSDSIKNDLSYVKNEIKNSESGKKRSIKKETRVQSKTLNKNNSRHAKNIVVMTNLMKWFDKKNNNKKVDFYKEKIAELSEFSDNNGAEKAIEKFNSEISQTIKQDLSLYKAERNNSNKKTFGDILKNASEGIKKGVVVKKPDSKSSYKPSMGRAGKKRAKSNPRYKSLKTESEIVLQSKLDKLNESMNKKVILDFNKYDPRFKK